MPTFLLDLLYLIALAGYAPFLILKMIRKGKYRESLPGSLGWRLKHEDAAKFANGSVWIHAVSVGEVVAAKALLPELKRALGDLPLVISTTTETGNAQARRSFPDAAAIIYYPIDLSWIVRRFLRTYNPRYFFLMETELWPNFLREVGRRPGTTAVMVNGKLSGGSARRYGRVRRILAPGLAAIRVFFVQNGRAQENFAVLSERPDDVVVAGNVKLDSLPQRITAERRAELRRAWGMDGDAARVLLFGSTHEDEETLALEAFAELRSEFVDVRLVICPRHPERFDSVWDEISATVERSADSKGEPFRAIRASAQTDDATDATTRSATDILLLDQMGVLAESYGAADIAVMGGTFAPIGGHNLLEATAHGVPMFCGPHVHAQVELVRLLREADLLLQIDASELGIAIADLLNDAERYEVLHRRSLNLVEARRGVGRRVFDELRTRGLLPASRESAEQ